MEKTRQRSESLHTLAIFHCLLVAGGELSGADILKRTFLLSGTLYPILRRLETEGHVVSRDGRFANDGFGTKYRCYYRLTKTGRIFADSQLDRIASQLGMRRIADSRVKA